MRRNPGLFGYDVAGAHSENLPTPSTIEDPTEDRTERLRRMLDPNRVSPFLSPGSIRNQMQDLFPSEDLVPVPRPGQKEYDPVGRNDPTIAGLLHSDVPGRTDQLAISVQPGAYVIPADVVSGLGQGNTTAGGKLFKLIFGEDEPTHLARGGTANEKAVPIVAAGGEFIVSPSMIKRKYGGDLKRGHDALDKMVRKLRMSIAKSMMKLPGPRRD
jgi:hypothetical protein